MATDSSILAWEIPWTEEPGRLQFMGSQRARQDWAAQQQQQQKSYVASAAMTLCCYWSIPLALDAMQMNEHSYVLIKLHLWTQEVNWKKKKRNVSKWRTYVTPQLHSGLMLQHFICALFILSFCGCDPLFPDSTASSLSLGSKQKAKSKIQGSKDLGSTPGLAVSSCESVGKALTSQGPTHFICNVKPSPRPPQISVTTSLQMSPHHFQGNHSSFPGFPLHDDF